MMVKCLCGEEFLDGKSKNAHWRNSCKHDESPHMIKERQKKAKETAPVCQPPTSDANDVPLVRPIEVSAPIPLPVIVTPSPPSIVLPSMRYAY